MKFTITAFMFLICTAALLSTAEGRPNPLRILRCKCIKINIHSNPPIHRSRILSLNVIRAGPHCKHEQIIATLKKGQTCLDPKADWVIALKKSQKTTTLSPKSN